MVDFEMCNPFQHFFKVNLCLKSNMFVPNKISFFYQDIIRSEKWSNIMRIILWYIVFCMLAIRRSGSIQLTWKVCYKWLHNSKSTMKLFHHTTFSKCVTTCPCSLHEPMLIMTTHVSSNTIAMTGLGEIKKAWNWDNLKWERASKY